MDFFMHAVFFICAACVITFTLINRRAKRKAKFDPDDFIEVDRPEDDGFMDDDDIELILNDHLPQIMKLQPGEALYWDGTDEEPKVIGKDAGSMDGMKVAAEIPLPKQEDFYGTIGVQYLDGSHPYIKGMLPTQWVKVTAPDYEAARRIIYHYSGGNYSTLFFANEFLKSRGFFFPDGEFEHLSHTTYWGFAGERQREA